MESEKDLEQGVENEILNEFVNGSDNTVETAENSLNNVKNAATVENMSLDNAVENVVDNEETMHEEDEENAADLEDDLETEIEEEDLEEEEDFDFPEEEEDILEDYIEDGEKEKGMDEVVSGATGDSAKNLENLQDLGELMIEFLDDSKAQLCSAISGQPPSQYASGKKLNKALLKAFTAYMNSQAVKAPSPLGTLLITLALWGLPALGTSYFHRRQAEKAKKEKAKEAVHGVPHQEEPEEVTGEAKSDSSTSSPKREVVDYTLTKEYKDKRRLFDVHANTGCYSRDLNGKFAKTSLAGEKPSPELQELIDKGYDNVKIRSILYAK